MSWKMKVMWDVSDEGFRAVKMVKLWACHGSLSYSCGSSSGVDMTEAMVVARNKSHASRVMNGLIGAIAIVVQAGTTDAV